MANFMDLPKAVRKKIYRLHLVADEQPVDFEAYKKICGYEFYGDDEHPLTMLNKGETRKMPPLFYASRNIEQEACPILFGENTFILSGPAAMDIWKRFMWRRHVKYIRKLVVRKGQSWWSAGNEAFSCLRTLSGLDSLVAVIDKEAILNLVFAKTGLYEGSPDPTYSILKAPHRPKMRPEHLGLGPQVYLQVLHHAGIRGLRTLRGLKHVRFIKSIDALDSDNPECEGGLPAGLLETIVKHEMMQPRCIKVPKYRQEETFRFLDLPPELRNTIYSMLLVFSGPTHPSIGKPISVTLQLQGRHQKARDALPVPHSALSLLCVNRQIHDEAQKLFYQNDLVFDTPAQLQTFMLSLLDERLDSLRSLTFFYEDILLPCRS